MNTWPNGARQALTQDEHETWNSDNYPGTLELCVLCDEPTGNCEEDNIFLDDETGPVCSACYEIKRPVDD